MSDIMITTTIVAPSQLQLDLNKYPKLDAKQVGHLRHFHNLATQLDGEWHHMGTQEPAQEFLDAYRYQLAVMGYGAGVAHYHRLPALRSVFKPLLRRLIHKMLRREVWGYWFTTSLSGNRTDPGRTELRSPWADPIVRENIMYSGHLMLMTSLYAMLFDDDEFEKPGSLMFHWDPLFYGLGPETFSYDNRSLQKAILAEMERNGWVGVCCEPNLVFVVCNQFPIIAMRYNDTRDGTNVVDGVLEKYWNAIQRKKMVAPDGLFVDWYFLNQNITKPPGQVGFTAWANAYMNSWNSNFIKPRFKQQAHGFITAINGEIRLNPPIVANEFRRLVATEHAPIDSIATLERALELAKHSEEPNFPYCQPTFGYVVQWLSEIGQTVELDGLLQYADERLHPTWEDGGLFYPRNDLLMSKIGDWTHMDPFSGNAAIGYARLNVEDGQKKMWEQPWTSKSLSERPWLDGLSLADGIDCLRGSWDYSESALILTIKSWNKGHLRVSPCARNLEPGTWAVYVNGKLSIVSDVYENRDLTINVDVGSTEVDVVFLKL